MKRNINEMYSIAMCIVILCLIPNCTFTVPMFIAYVVMAIVVSIDIIRTVLNFIKLRDKEKYINYLKDTSIRYFYRTLHEYFGKIDKNYPDNAFDIAAAGYHFLKEYSDLFEYGYEMYLTSGRVKQIKGHPHYWITIFDPEDASHLYPFIIDINSVRYLPDRNMPFDEMIEQFGPTVLSVNDKAFKDYRPIRFIGIDDTGNYSMSVMDKKIIIDLNTEKSSMVDFETIDKMIGDKILNHQFLKE